MRNTIKMYFNEAGTEAQLIEHVCLFGTGLCTPCHFMHGVTNMMAVKEPDGSWTRNEYPTGGYGAYIMNGLKNDPVWTSQKRPRTCGSVYRGPEKMPPYGCGYKRE